VELVRYEDADFGLAEALETDPVVMRELGGPIDRERLAEVHQRRLNEPWYFKIVPVASGPPAGTIGIWEKQHDDATIFETGWMVLPAFQDRGIATAALDLLIQRVRDEPGLDAMHAFPPVTNAPSNALCRKFDFSLLGQRDFVYAGRTLRCNHWMLAVTGRRSSSAPSCSRTS
jgi:RimJ/RimL family protein N-acetyltransferase